MRNCHYIPKKYRVEISSDGNFADIYLLTGALKSCFHISINQGKAILTDDIKHTMSVIPTPQEVISCSSFTYDEETDSLSVNLILENEEEMKFKTFISDLMDKDEPCFEHHHKCHCERPNKPMIEGFATKSDLKEEAIRRKKEDDKIYEILGVTNSSTESLSSQISAVDENLKYEIARSKQRDLEHTEKVKQIHCELYHLKNGLKELNSEINEVSKNNDAKYNELYSVCEGIRSSICDVKTDLSEVDKSLRRETQRAIEAEHELEETIQQEAKIREEEDNKLHHEIIHEETLRHKADDEIRQELKNEVSVLNNRISEFDDKYQRKGDYVSYTEIEPNRKGIILDNHSNILGKGTDNSTYNLAMVSKWNVADFGSSALPLNLNGNKARPTYNDKDDLALYSDVETINNTLTELIENNFNLLNTAISQLLTQFDGVNDKLNELSTQNSILENTIEALQNANDTMQEKIDSMQTALDGIIDSGIANLDKSDVDTIINATQEIDNIKTSLDDANKQIDDLSISLDDANEQIDDLSTLLEDNIQTQIVIRKDIETLQKQVTIPETIQFIVEGQESPIIVFNEGEDIIDALKKTASSVVGSYDHIDGESF